MTDRQYANTTCPYCDSRLDPLPKAKKACPACRKPIYVRVGPDGMTYLLQEADRPVLEQAWAEHRMAQAWRRRSLELVDEATLERTGSEMRAKDPRYTDRDVYWAIANQDVLHRLKVGDWYEVKMAYFRMALAAWEEAEYPMEMNGRVDEPDRAWRLMREANLAELRAISSSIPVTSVTILARCCPPCDAGADMPRSLADELRQPVLPHTACEQGLCRCEYLPELESVRWR